MRRRDSFQNLILERHAFRVVFLEPNLGRDLGRKDLEVILVADLLGGVDVNPDCHRSLLSFSAKHVIKLTANALPAHVHGSPETQAMTQQTAKHRPRWRSIEPMVIAWSL